VELEVHEFSGSGKIWEELTMQGQNFETKEKLLVDMYKAKGFGTCGICKKCRQEILDAGQEGLYPPVGAFSVGANFDNQKIKLMIVGKVARGEYPDGYGAGLREAQKSGGMWGNRSWAFWNYTRLICKNVYGDDSIGHIALTNIIQCNNSHDIDVSTTTTIKYCIAELKVLKEEIKIIKPNTIVFYTVAKYDDYISLLFDEYNETVVTTKAIGKKTMPWRESIGVIEGFEAKINILRVGHPERMKKVDYTDEVSEWVLRVNS
jgi:hypothetical protein